MPPGADLEGRFDAFSIFDVLQFLDATRQRGRLSLRTAEGEGWMEFAEGLIGDASALHLSGACAALWLLGRRSGTFRFERMAALATGEIALGMLLMDAVRLEDERDRRAELLPEPHTPLVLRFPDHVPVDSWDCRLADVVAKLAAGRITRAKLEAELPIAPVKIQLALAVLVEAGVLGEGTPSSSSLLLRRAGGSLESALLARFPSGLRLVVGCGAATSSHDLVASLNVLADELHAPLPSPRASAWTAHSFSAFDRKPAASCL